MVIDKSAKFSTSENFLEHYHPNKIFKLAVQGAYKLLVNFRTGSTLLATIRKIPTSTSMYFRNHFKGVLLILFSPN